MPFSEMAVNEISLSQKLLCSSIQMFADIFSQTYVTNKNKLNLLKHLLAHCQPQKQKEQPQALKK